MLDSFGINQNNRTNSKFRIPTSHGTFSSGTGKRMTGDLGYKRFLELTWDRVNKDSETSSACCSFVSAALLGTKKTPQYSIYHMHHQSIQHFSAIQHFP